YRTRLTGRLRSGFGPTAPQVSGAVGFFVGWVFGDSVAPAAEWLVRRNPPASSPGRAPCDAEGASPCIRSTPKTPSIQPSFASFSQFTVKFSGGCALSLIYKQFSLDSLTG